MSYLEAKAKYAALGIDTDAAIAKLKNVPVSLHCWQGDDVRGFDTDPTKPLTGGIQTTGNYPGRARTPEELMADLDMVLKLCPGTKKMNLHASYAIFEDGDWEDRDKLEPKHFKKWVDFCKERGLGCDFNPTFFSHPKANGLTLSSPDPEIRKFWINHGKSCIRISTYLAEELGQPCVMNIWTGDGFKDIPADRMGPRVRYKKAIDEILSEPFDFNKVKPCVESKVFGIGVEAYTVGSAEFSLSYAAMNKDTQLIDSVSKAGKLTGNGNGMQYLGAILIKSGLAMEQLDSYYSHYRENKWEYLVTVQTGCDLSFIELDQLRFLQEVTADGYYIVYSWGRGIELFEMLDIRGH